MNRSNPPCNTCTHIDCRNCSWLSPLDASYQTISQHHSLFALLAVGNRNGDRNEERDGKRPPRPPSTLRTSSRRIARFFSGFVPCAR